MVTSYNMMETEMGYRGSKSVLTEKTSTVKEQRVDGSWSIGKIKNNPILLRCTLMGFERNYQIKIPTNHLNKRNKRSFSTLTQSNINPWFITGF